MHPAGERKCLHCEEFFTPDARNRKRQHYCAKESCRRASKAASQQRWLRHPENTDYFRDVDNAARVRAWQAADCDCVVQLLPTSHWHASTAGKLEFRIIRRRRPRTHLHAAHVEASARVRMNRPLPTHRGY